MWFYAQVRRAVADAGLQDDVDRKSDILKLKWSENCDEDDVYICFYNFLLNNICFFSQTVLVLIMTQGSDLHLLATGLYPFCQCLQDSYTCQDARPISVLVQGGVDVGTCETVVVPFVTRRPNARLAISRPVDLVNSMKLTNRPSSRSAFLGLTSPRTLPESKNLADEAYSHLALQMVSLRFLLVWIPRVMRVSWSWWCWYALIWVRVWDYTKPIFFVLMLMFLGKISIMDDYAVDSKILTCPRFFSTLKVMAISMLDDHCPGVMNESGWAWWRSDSPLNMLLDRCSFARYQIDTLKPAATPQVKWTNR